MRVYVFNIHKYIGAYIRMCVCMCAHIRVLCTCACECAYTDVDR